VPSSLGCRRGWWNVQADRGGSMKRGLVRRLEGIEAAAGGSGRARTLWVVEVPPEMVDFDAAVDLAFANDGVQPQSADDVVIITLICRGDRPKVTSRTALRR
jgi:hypothetical protein